MRKKHLEKETFVFSSKTSPDKEGRLLLPNPAEKNSCREMSFHSTSHPLKNCLLFRHDLILL